MRDKLFDSPAFVSNGIQATPPLFVHFFLSRTDAGHPHRSIYIRQWLVMLHIGDKVRDYRKRSLLTQEELAEKSEGSVTTIIRIERNQVKPHGQTIRRLAEALGVEPVNLVDNQ